MIYLIYLAIACLIAMWFCYWVTRAFSARSNRACRIASLACPVLLAILVAVFPDVILNPLGDFLAGLHYLSSKVEAFPVVLAALLTVPTLLITALVEQARSMTDSRSNSK